MKVALLPQAAVDLDAIGDPLYIRVLKRLEVLGAFPELGAPMAGAFTDSRSTVVELFRVVYRIRADLTVEIAYIRDCRRRMPVSAQSPLVRPRSRPRGRGAPCRRTGHSS